MRLEGKRVLVAGGAAAGAATALLLARSGARVTLCERVAEPRAVGAGLALAPNGWAVLGALGLTAELAPLATPVAAPRIVDARGHTLLEPRLPGCDDPVAARVVRRSDFQRVLLGAVARQPGIAARFGVEVVLADADGRALLRGARGESEEAFDLVVGADGTGSAVRSADDFSARRRTTGISYLRGLIDTEHDGGTEAWTAQGLFGIFGVPGGTYFFSSLGTPALRRALAGRDLGALREIWSAALPAAAPILAAVDSFDRLLINEVVEIRCRWLHSGRRVLVGDAAHAMAPNLGQGANSALVDAAVLAAELGRATDLDAALAAYTVRRLPAVTRVQRTSARLGHLAERTSPAMRWLRDRLLLPLAARLSGPRGTRELLQEPLELLRDPLAAGR